MAEQTKFSVLCSLFSWIQRSKSSAKKRSKFRKFLDTFCKPNDYFSAIRLILPNLDRERGSYGLKESTLSNCLIDALGMSKESEDAHRLINWRKGGPKTGAFAGNYALVAAEVLQRRQGTASGGLTIKELNDLLDKLASSESRADKTSVLATLIQKTNAQEMKWIVMIILKDLKLGTSEKSIFHEFHPDAEDLFNVTCDLKLVCEKLRDRNQRHKRQDIEVGKAVRPQLAMRVSDASAAWKKLHGKEVVVECKFDGDRIQIHKNGKEIRFFSRNFLDHSEYVHAMSDLIIQNVVPDRCILDGEMLVWDTSLNRFAEFGSNQEIAKTARDGLDSDRQLCYIAFDILYVGDTSVIHQSLKERHELLRKVVRPSKGRLEILVPNTGLNTHRTPGEPCRSLIAHSMDDIERFFKETIENRDEGIVIKDLASKWEPGDRSGKWLKLKPEYIRAGSDLDCLIIGGYYGSGRRGGEVAQFLVGLAERPDTNTYPRRFISFCRVGTGLSDDELDALVTKLKPYLRKYEYPKKSPPSYYQVTNNSKERPDVWIESPEKSVILAINSDIRTISSEVFAAPYSLRFPRIERVRYDKPWYECLDVQSFLDLVHSSNGTTQRETGYGGTHNNKPKRVNSPKGRDKRNMSVLPSHLIQTDVSNVKGHSLIFSNMVFYFVNVPPTWSINSLCKLVAENGGTFSMNLNTTVTHCVAADSKGFKFEAAKRHGDIIHYSWVMDCSSQKKLVTLQPKYFIFLSEPTKKKLQEEVDEFSDSYYCDVDLSDLKQLLNNIPRSEGVPAINHYRKKYCPKSKWCRFHDSCIYFHIFGESIKQDWKILLEFVSRRLKLEVLIGGGKVTESLAHATHLVILSEPKNNVDFENLLRSFTAKEKKFLCSKKVHVVRSQWLEGCLAEDQRLSEERYSLKPDSREESSTEEWENDLASQFSSGVKNLGDDKMSRSTNIVREETVKASADEDHKLISSTIRGRKRSRGRPATRGFKRTKSVANQTRRTRLHISRRPAKISEYDTDESGSHDERTSYGELLIAEASPETHIEIQEMEMKVDSGLSDNNKAENREAMDLELEKQRVPEVETSNKDNINSEKVGQVGGVDDPVQAMLLNMIPTLAMPNAQGKETPSIRVEIPPAEPPAKLVNKKKVSYKDVAGDLLRDW